jgi:hypothetical protein
MSSAANIKHKSHRQDTEGPEYGGEKIQRHPTEAQPDAREDRTPPARMMVVVMMMVVLGHAPK